MGTVASQEIKKESNGLFLKCKLCQKLINLQKEFFYYHDPSKHIIQRCCYTNNQTSIIGNYPTDIIDKEYFLACEECNVLNDLVPQLPLNGVNYACSLCNSVVFSKQNIFGEEQFKPNSNAFMKLGEFICAKCFKKFCCFQGCKRKAHSNCMMCTYGFCGLHINSHKQTHRKKELEGITSYSCDVSRSKINVHELEITVCNENY